MQAENPRDKLVGAASPQNEEAARMSTSLPLVLSFLKDAEPQVREHALAKVLQHRSELRCVPTAVIDLLFQEPDARLVAKGIEVVSAFVSHDPVARPLLTYFLSDPRKMVAQRVHEVMAGFVEIPLEVRFPYQSALALAFSRKGVALRGKDLYQELSPYRVVDGVALAQRPFLGAVEALCHPAPALQEIAVHMLWKACASLNERQRGVVEAACTYACHKFLSNHSNQYDAFMELFREVSSGPVSALMVQDIECGDNLNLRLHRDFTAVYLSRMAPLPKAVEQLIDCIWHHVPGVVHAAASNLGVLLEEVPRETAEHMLDCLFEALVERVADSHEVLQGLLKAVERQTLFEASIVKRVSEIVSRSPSSSVLSMMIEVLRRNPPQHEDTRKSVGAILRFLAGCESARVADSARDLIGYPDDSTTEL